MIRTVGELREKLSHCSDDTPLEAGHWKNEIDICVCDVMINGDEESVTLYVR